MPSLLEWLIENKKAPLLAAAVGLLLAVPALWAGLVADDFVHRAILLGDGLYGVPVEPTMDLFSFIKDGAIRDQAARIGLIAWWTDPQTRIALWRPLAALTHVLDYAIWPHAIALQHLHSLLWYALAVTLVGAAYRRVHGVGPVAGLAALLFAVDDAHAMPAGWLANRNALLCVSCGALVLLGHLRWRQRGLWRDLGAALLALALGLLAGEATLGILAYVAAWELTQPAPRWARKLMALLPYGIIVVAWRLLYDGLGYGTYGSQLYLDPVHQPWSYLGALIERWPLLFFAQWSQAPVDLWLFLTRDQQLALLAMVVPASAAVTAFLWPAWRHDRLVRFWLIGMALSLVPLCAAFPMDRLLIFAGIGGFGALATIAISATAPGHGEGRVAVGAWRTTVARVLLALHLPIAAGLLLIRTAGLPVLGTVVSQGARESPADDAVSDQLFVFVNGFDFAVGYTWILRSREGSGPAPDSVTRLASMATDNAVSREDERTLVIAPTDGFISAAIDGLLLNPDRAFHPGEVITRTDFQAEIRAATSDGRPTVVAFRFHLPLEDSRYRFLFWENGRITELPLPAVGQQILIRRSLPSWSES